MPEGRQLIALIVIIVLVIGVNGMLINALRGRGDTTVQTAAKALRTSRRPFAAQQDQLDELARRVAALKETNPAPDAKTDQPE